MKLACKPKLTRTSVVIDHGKIDKAEVERMLAICCEVVSTIPVYESVLLQALELVDGFCTEIPFEDATETLKHNVLYLMEVYDLFKDFTDIDKAFAIVDHMLHIMDPHERSHLYDYKYKDITDEKLMSMITLACNEMATCVTTVTETTAWVQFCTKDLNAAENIVYKLSGMLPGMKFHGTFIEPDKTEVKMNFENGTNLTRQAALIRVSKEIEESGGEFVDYITEQIASATGVPSEYFKPYK